MKNILTHETSTMFPTPQNPFELFDVWYADAKQKLGEEDGSAMCLATSTREGKPSARMVLLKHYDDRGFVFYTNRQSRKGTELESNPHAALCFYWTALDRQVRIEGNVTHATAKEADTYFNSRHPDSRRGAWASEQSKPLETPEILVARAKAMKQKYSDDDNIPRPPHWIGYRLAPLVIEFWQEGKNRLHDRACYKNSGGVWTQTLLYP